ncbi:MAG: glycosyltransferase family 2 protein [Clostridia bacterium]|nr:glycosyltransferase family 2 protein [Clostridia bacterium]
MISVIVPVYNGEKTIENTLKSILAQTYKDIEVIAINDGSTDGTIDVLEAFSKQDDRLKIVNKQNGGVSSARNAGLKIVNGEYITFVDADDATEADMYELLINAIEKYDADIAHCGYKRIENGEEMFSNTSGKVYVQSCDEALACLIEGRLFAGGIWNKLYKKNLFDGVRFDETIKINEDLLVNYFAFKNADKSVYIDSAKYIYNMQSESATHIVDQTRFVLDREKVARIICDNEVNAKRFNSAQKHLFDALKTKYLLYSKLKTDDSKQICKETANEMHGIVKSGAITSTKDKLICFIEKDMRWIFPFVYFVYDKIRKPNIDVEKLC